MKKIFIIAGGLDYERMFKDNGWTVVDNIEEASLVQFCGGADVGPQLYGEPKHPRTFSDSGRDYSDEIYYNQAINLGLPMAGICRGGQFLNVMNGGSMLQHVHDHAIGGTHALRDMDTGKGVDVSSTHHQMMVAGEGGAIVAEAYICTRKEWMKEVAGEPVLEWNYGDGSDTEVVWYAETSSLCFQPHPEFFDPSHPCQAYYFELLERYY